MAASDNRVRSLQKPLASKGASTDGKQTLPLRLNDFPNRPLFRDAIPDEPADVQADQVHDFACRLRCSDGRHSRGDPITLGKLILDRKLHVGIERVDLRDASPQTVNVSVTRGRMPDVVLSYD